MFFKKILIAFLIGIILLFIVQNIAKVEIQFLLWSFTLPRAIILLLFLLIGIIIGWLWHGHLTHDQPKE